MKPIAAPLPPRRHLRLVRDGERAPDGFIVSPREMAAGHQVSLPSLPVGEPHSHECRSRRQRLTAATKWLRIVLLALEWGRARPLEALAAHWRIGSPRRSRRLVVADQPMERFMRSFGRAHRSRPLAADFGSKPLAVGRRALTNDERREMRQEFDTLRSAGWRTEPPRTWDECADADEPWCPWVSCRHHLYLEQDPSTGTLFINHPGKEVWELKDTCSLKVANENPNGLTHDEVAERLNITHHWEYKCEAEALKKMRAKTTRFNGTSDDD